MPHFAFSSTSRFRWLALCTVLVSACATPVYDKDGGSSDPLEGEAGEGNAIAGATNGESGSSSAGAPNPSAGSTGVAGSMSNGGAPAAGASNGGTSTGGSSTSAGANNNGGAGKGGTSAGGSANGGAGKGGTSAGGSPSVAGAANGGSGSAGAPTTVPCNAANAKATLTHNMLYTGTGKDCVRLTVNPDWAQVTVSFTPQPGTVYPVPFTYTSACAPGGNLTLTANYADAIIKSGANPGCDYFVQFKGGNTVVKVYYYD